MSNATMTLPETKVCIKCELEKPLSDFHRDNARKDGHVNTCRTCWNSYDRQRGQTLRRKASIALKDARRSRQRIEKELGKPIEDTLTFLDVYWTLSDKECSYCGKEVPELDRTLDHITSMRYNGGNTFDNICMACRTCNIAKNDLPVITYMLQSCDADEARKLIDHIASRGNKTFHEAFKDLTEFAQEYYAVQAEKATEKAKERTKVR